MRKRSHSRPSSKPVHTPEPPKKTTKFVTSKADPFHFADAKARKDMADKAKGKGPLNAGQQGIKKSGKK